MENVGRHVQGGMAFTENDVASHATDIFRTIEQEVSMLDANTITIRPMSNNQQGPFQFNIPNKGNQYVQLNQVRMYVKFQVLDKATSAPIKLTAGVGLCNLPANSLFESIDVEIGGKQISELQNNHLPYKAYLDTLLSYSVESKMGHLAASGWDPDTATKFDDLAYGTDTTTYTTKGKEMTINNTLNRGLVGRREHLDQPGDYMFPLHCDFFNTERLLPPGVELSVKLTRIKDAFVLMHLPPTNGTEYKINVLELKMHVPFISVAPAILERHIEVIQKEPILLPIKKTEITAHHFGEGVSNIYMSNLFQNRLPKTLILGMLSTGSYNGTVDTNPYNFKHFGVNHVQAIRNGVAIPNEPYTPDWTNMLYNRELRSFFDNIGIGTDNLSCGMTSALYVGGASLFAWDFTPDRCNGYHWHRREPGGVMDISLKFKTPIPKGGVTVMLFAVYDVLVSIDKDNQVAVTI